MLTGFVSDPDRRDEIGTSIIMVTLLYLLINVIFALKDILTPYYYRAKYCCIKQKMIRQKEKEKKEREQKEGELFEKIRKKNKNE